MYWAKSPKLNQFVGYCSIQSQFALNINNEVQPLRARHWIQFRYVSKHSLGLRVTQMRNCTSFCLKKSRDAWGSLNEPTWKFEKYADQRRRLLVFKLRDKEMLKLTQQMWKKLTTKRWHSGLFNRSERPFQHHETCGRHDIVNIDRRSERSLALPWRA